MFVLSSITLLGIEMTSILIWALMGIVCGIVAAIIWGGRRMLAFDMGIGLIASCGGGCASMVAIGDASQYQFELATLTAFFFAALALFLFGWFVSRNAGR